MKYKFYILTMLVFVSLASCHQDKGNYDYIDVNDFRVALEDKYLAKKMTQDFVIAPDLEILNAENDAHMSYLWKDMSSGLSWDNNVDTVGQELNLTYKIDIDADDFTYQVPLGLEVRDNSTGVRLLYTTTLEVIKPYENAWMVLHADADDGKARLGSVEYIYGDMIVNYDSYFNETGSRLTGEPCKLGKTGCDHYYTIFEDKENAVDFYCLTTNKEESGILAQENYFDLRAPMKMLLPVESDYNAFDMNSVSCIGAAGETAVTMTSNGVMYAGGGTSSRFAMISIVGDHDVPGELDMQLCTRVAHVDLAYDKAGKRFLMYNSRYNSWTETWTPTPSDVEGANKLQYLIKTDDCVQEIDMYNIGDDIDMVYMGPGIQYGTTGIATWQRYSMFAIGVNSIDPSKAHAFEFHARSITNPTDATDPAPFSYYAEISCPPGLTKDTPMATNYSYNRIAFYAAGNKIYKLDFGTIGGSYTLLYEHDDPAATATALRLGRSIDDEEDLYGSVPFDADRCLGVSFNTSEGNGELVVLLLNTAGGVSSEGTYDYPSVQVFTEDAEGNKFGPIKDIEFI